MSKNQEPQVVLALDAGVRESGSAVFREGKVEDTGVVGMRTRQRLDPEVRIVRLLAELAAVQVWPGYGAHCLHRTRGARRNSQAPQRLRKPTGLRYHAETWADRLRPHHSRMRSHCGGALPLIGVGATPVGHKPFAVSPSTSSGRTGYGSRAATLLINTRCPPS